MSEALKKLREEYIRKKKIDLTRIPPTHKQARTLIDFDKRIEEARKKEQQLKTELERTRERTLHDLRTRIDRLISEESSSHGAYTTLAELAKALGFKPFDIDFRRIADEEHRHQQILLTAFKDLPEK